LIRGVPHQSVLEGEGRIRTLACPPEHQLRGDQLVERGLELRLGPVGDCGEQRVRELPANRGADLGDLLHRGEAIEARK
jgi:hypothetical protein